jgi:hypothetical protein
VAVPAALAQGVCLERGPTRSSADSGAPRLAAWGHTQGRARQRLATTFWLAVGLMATALLLPRPGSDLNRTKSGGFAGPGRVRGTTILARHDNARGWAPNPAISAGVCVPAVKDFATVRNRSARTTGTRSRGHRPSCPTANPSPADVESVLEAAPQEFESPILRCLRLRVDHLVQHQSTINDPG